MTQIEAIARTHPVVRRRRVFYIPGFDPAHARRYREMYRTEGARQAELSGYRLEVQGLPGNDVYAWDVRAEMDGAITETRIETLEWADIVQAAMGGGPLALYRALAATAWVYLSTGALFRLMGLRKGPMIGAFYPVLFLIAQLALAVALAALAGWALSLWQPWAAWAGLAAIPVVLEWFRRNDSRFMAQYLIYEFAFTAQGRGTVSDALAARMAVFADRIGAALAEEVDEVLVVGHSSGTQIGVSVAAEVLRQAPSNGPVLSFLTLGQVIPMASFLPGATQLRADLAALSRSDRVTWVDVSAPGDGCTFALCDPVAVSGAATVGKQGPLVLSAAYSQTLKPETWTALRWRFFRLHFQYLCAFDGLKNRFDEYDYFRITAGPMTLGARLGARRPSPARIERAVSGYGLADAAE